MDKIVQTCQDHTSIQDQIKKNKIKLSRRVIPTQDQIKKWIKLSKHIVFTQDHSPIQDQIK